MLSTTSTIRLATCADAPLIDPMVREIALHEGSPDSVESGPDHWRAMLAREDVRVFLAVDGEAVLGYVSTVRRLNLWLGADVISLDDLWVREGGRRRGVGRRLMLAVAKFAAEESLTVVWGARLDNDDAHRFYRRLGAHLTTKVVASWAPEQYLPALAVEGA